MKHRQTMTTKSTAMIRTMMVSVACAIARNLFTNFVSQTVGLCVKVPDAFCVNGIEIDLKELEELERRVAAKRRAAVAASCSSSSAGEKLEESFEKSLKISETARAPVKVQQPSLASMFLVIMSIFSILNQTHFKPTARS